MSMAASIAEQLDNLKAVVQMLPSSAPISATVSVWGGSNVQIRAQDVDIVREIADMSAATSESYTNHQGIVSVIHKAPVRTYPTVMLTWVTSA